METKQKLSGQTASASSEPGPFHSTSPWTEWAATFDDPRRFASQPAADKGKAAKSKQNGASAECKDALMDCYNG